MDKHNYELIVAGGGFAGAAAALAAARSGVRTLLVERSYNLGGAAANSLVFPFMQYITDGQLINAGIFKEICNCLASKGALRGNFDFHEEYLKLVLEQLMEESGVTVLYGAQIVEAQKTGQVVTSVTAAARGTSLKLSAKFFIDASGDANLAYLAGVPCAVGRKEDGLCQAMTLCFRVSGIDYKLLWQEYDNIQTLYKQFQAQGKIKNPRENILTFEYVLPGVIHFNTTRIVNKSPLDAFMLSRAQIEAREQVFEMLCFLKDNFKAFENAGISQTAPEIGVRESRRIEGDYELTEEDLLSYKVFEDSVACGCYPIDIHNPSGKGTHLIYLEKGRYYTIPYRSLIPKTVSNMLVAGRCICSTHVAQSAYRIMPIVCNIGEGAGTAIAVALNGNTDTRGVNIQKVQRLLKANGARYN